MTKLSPEAINLMTQHTDKWIAQRVVELETEIAQLRKDCAPFQAQIDQRKTYEVRCIYCKRTPTEAEGGHKCSTCGIGGEDE